MVDMKGNLPQKKPRRKRVIRTESSRNGSGSKMAF